MISEVLKIHQLDDFHKAIDKIFYTFVQMYQKMNEIKVRFFFKLEITNFFFIYYIVEKLLNLL